jgi:isopenicillin N synthase-like dioxygenase
MHDTLPADVASRLAADGYLRLTLPNVGRRRLADAVDVAYEFFGQPAQDKLRNQLPDDCGYRPPGIEYSQSADRPDPIESFTAAPRAQGNGLAQAAQRLTDCLIDLYGCLEPLVELLTTRVAASLTGAGEQLAFKGAFARWSCLQVNHSTPAATVDALIHGAHEDGHLWTFAHATAPGLEVLDVLGNFNPATTGPGEIIVMPGGIAHLLSGGHVRPLYHRVRPHRQVAERLAVLLFADIPPDQAAPWVKNSVNADIDIGDRIRSNAARFGLSGFSKD